MSYDENPTAGDPGPLPAKKVHRRRSTRRRPWGRTTRFLFGWLLRWLNG